MTDQLIFREDVVADVVRRLSLASNSMHDLQSQLKRVQNDMTWGARNAPIHGSRADALVSEQVRLLGEYSQRISSLSNRLQTASGRFIAAENQLAQVAVGQAKALVGENRAGTVRISWPFAILFDGMRDVDWQQLWQAFAGKAISFGEATLVTPWKDYLWSFIGGFGNVGKTAKSARDVFTKWQAWFTNGGSMDPLELGRLAKDTFKGGFGIGKNVSKLKKYARNYKKYKNLVGAKKAKTYYLKKAFGLNKYWDGHDAAHTLTNKMKKLKDGTKVVDKLGNFKTNFGKVFKSEMSLKEHADSYVFAAIGSFIDNVGDLQSGKIDSADRFVVEWATETVTDVAVGAACSALAGAGLAALGVTAAPAVAVAAAGAIIGAGANAICKWATRELFGEEYNIAQGVGHLVGEGYDWAKKQAGQLTKAVSDKAARAGKAIGDAASKAGKAAKDAGKAVCKWVKSLF